MAISVFDLFKIGIGPSSSHTVGPMRAAFRFVKSLEKANLLNFVHSIKVNLYGSLGATGRGHGSDRGVMLGLLGEQPDSVNVDLIDTLMETIITDRKLSLLGKHKIDFSPRTDIQFLRQTLPSHPNALTFTATGIDETSTHTPTKTTRAKTQQASKRILLSKTYLSVGGGFIVTDGASNDDLLANNVALTYPFSSGDELLKLCRQHNFSIAELMRSNERKWHSDNEIETLLLQIWQVMKASIERGCKHSRDNGNSRNKIISNNSHDNANHSHDSAVSQASQTTNPNDPLLNASSPQKIIPITVLPGPLAVKRRAPALYSALLAADTSADNLIAMDWISLYAIAVNEENAAGGRVVTAPTNGAAGIIPAVLQHYMRTHLTATQSDVVNFFLTAGAIGILYKLNASISGAEVGCQGEVGVACSMAAAALAAVLGGTPEQVENAAEIGMEHNLGLTCDPVGGRVQIPCIERNAMGAVKAVNAARIALRGDGTHVVSLDSVIKTMRETGADMKLKYKETSRGGLAVNIVEC